VTYTYDGDLRRADKSSGTLYWYCASCGRVLAESDLSGNLISEYTYFGGLRIARRDISSGNVYYIFSDRLGSYRTLTDSSGNVKGESDYYPFGAERVISNTVTENFRFAGMEWDTEDGLNHTLYRQYTPAQCRWESPDPVRGCASFPQGQNLYPYVRDNPTNLMDPNGNLLMNAGCDPRCSNICFYLYNADTCPAECPPDAPGGCGTGGGGGGGGGGGSGDCKAWYSGEGQAMGLDLCKGKEDHPVLQYSWQCRWEGANGKDCCLGKADAASSYCDKPHEGIGWESDLGRWSVGDKYGCCCGRRKNQIRPPVPPGSGNPY